MNTTKVISVTILSALAGLLVGFSLTVLPQRAANARLAPPDFSAAEHVSFSQPSTAPSMVNAGAETGGVGGNFVKDVYRQVSPAVVHITNKSVYERFDFFRGRQQYETEATGSGVIVEETGYILTNFHVIKDAQEIIVVLSDGREMTAEIIGSDPGTDLALIKISADDKLPTAALGDSDAIEVGDWVVAIGNPRGFDWTVTTGVISAMGREIPNQMTGQTIRGLIQTDASINPGNSGGPLLNTSGEIIGINELIVSTSGGSQGIGLAIPINTARVVLDDLIKHGRVIRPWLGIEVLAEINERMARSYRLPVDYGTVIKVVYSESPAQAGGLQRYLTGQRSQHFSYDIITAVDGARVDSERVLLDLIRDREPGEIVTIDFYRITDGAYEAMQTDIELKELPADAPMMGIV